MAEHTWHGEYISLGVCWSRLMFGGCITQWKRNTLFFGPFRISWDLT
jgi:hypothetical protein